MLVGCFVKIGDPDLEVGQPHRPNVEDGGGHGSVSLMWPAGTPPTSSAYEAPTVDRLRGALLRCSDRGHLASVYLQGIDSAEIIDTVHGRRSPVISASAGLQISR